MKLTSDLPNWIAWPLRFLFYAMVIFILYNISTAILTTRLSNNIAQCSGSMQARQGDDPLGHAKEMITCLESRNSFPENVFMTPLSNAIKALPNNPERFIGTWRSSQPKCDYLFELYLDGEFFAKPISCAISSRDFHGVWGVYENKMVWLYEQFNTWQPDINDMDVVSSETFLLLEKDGRRTLFTRVQENSFSQQQMPTKDTIRDPIEIF